MLDFYRSSDNPEGQLTGSEAAARLKRLHPMKKPSEIASMLGLAIDYGSWFPVTAGEFDGSSETITVNVRADADPEEVIAHELGHFLLSWLGVDQNEAFCEEFALELSGNSLS